jgi:hypothetical protein
LEPGLDAVAVELGRIVHYQPDAHSSSNPHAGAHSNSGPHAGAHTHSDSDSGYGMQRDSDLDLERDLYRWAAREPERLHL